MFLSKTYLFEFVLNVSEQTEQTSVDDNVALFDLTTKVLSFIECIANIECRQMIERHLKFSIIDSNIKNLKAR